MEVPMLERFSFFLEHFPLFLEHNSKEDPEKTLRYEVGLRRLRLLRRIAQPFAWGPPERARQFGEQVYAFLAITWLSERVCFKKRNDNCRRME